MDIGVWNTFGFCFGINLCGNSRDPSIWQSDGGTESSITKRYYSNMPYGVLPITLVELSSIKDKVKRI